MSIWGKGNSGGQNVGGDGFNGDSNFDSYGNELAGDGRGTPDLGGYQRGLNRTGDGIDGDSNFDINNIERTDMPQGRGTPDLGGYQRGLNRAGDDFDGDSNFDRNNRELDGSARFVPDLGGYQNRQHSHWQHHHSGGLDDEPTLRAGGTTRHGAGVHGGFDEQRSMNTGCGVAGGHGRSYSSEGTTTKERKGGMATTSEEEQHRPSLGEKIKDSFSKITHHTNKTETGGRTANA